MIHLIVGNTGAGKTTYSNHLKQEKKAILFSIDFWNNTLFMPDRDELSDVKWFLNRINRVEAVIENYIMQLNELNIDVILDLGLSKFEHREKFRQFAKENNIKVRLHFIDISKEVRWKRVQERNAQKGETFEFEVSKSDFDFMETWFETPTITELKNAIIIK
jgi:predicted kinase